MANKRMFAKTIIDSDAFLDMPLSTQALYFHLSMRADDDGFVNNPKKISRMIGCGEDDLRLLIAKKFILIFESGVVVIKHWLIHNTIRKDRKIPTNYQNELAELTQKENGSYTRNPITTGLERVDVTPDNQLTTNWQPNDNQMATNCPHSIVEISIVEDSIDKTIDQKPLDNKLSESDIKNDFEKLWKLYPNKKGKANALKAYKKAIKDGVTNKEIQDGILAYKKEIEIKGTDKQFIKHGGTWFNNQGWEDDYDHEPPKQKNDYRKNSNHNEIIPSWAKNKENQDEHESAPAKPTMSDEELREKLKELGISD